MSGAGAGLVKGCVSECKHAIESQFGLSLSDDSGDSETNRGDQVVKLASPGPYFDTCVTRSIISGKDSRLQDLYSRSRKSLQESSSRRTIGRKWEVEPFANY